MDRPSAKYEIIHSIVSQKDNLQNVKELCKIAGVSRSGYYNWLASEDKRLEREAKDKHDFELILNAYSFRGYDKGIRGIHMRLLHMDPPVLMNIKKIQRLMRKYGLSCPIPQSKSLSQDGKSFENGCGFGESFESSVQRARPQKGSPYGYYLHPLLRCVLLSVHHQGCLHTMQILAYVLSESLEIDFVLETVNLLLSNHGQTLDCETLIHSDQGCHYTSKKFRQIVKDAELRQSMSRRGNCWDNAPQESFFGHMKDEIGGKIAACDSFAEAKAVIDDYMDYYNNDRGQNGNF